MGCDRQGQGRRHSHATRFFRDGRTEEGGREEDGTSLQREQSEVVESFGLVQPDQLGQQRWIRMRRTGNCKMIVYSISFHFPLTFRFFVLCFDQEVYFYGGLQRIWIGHCS